jgi:hypothetical protein
MGSVYSPPHTPAWLCTATQSNTEPTSEDIGLGAVPPPLGGFFSSISVLLQGLAT